MVNRNNESIEDVNICIILFIRCANMEILNLSQVKLIWKLLPGCILYLELLEQLDCLQVIIATYYTRVCWTYTLNTGIEPLNLLEFG